MANRGILFSGGIIAEEDRLVREDLLVEEGKVVDRGEGIEPSPGIEVVDCSGQFLLPGLVDVHVHFGLEAGGIRTADDFSSGTKSAAVGGVTTVADFMDQVPGTPLAEVLAQRNAYCSGAAVDWTNHFVITQWSSVVEDELEMLANEGHARSVKLFTTYRSRGLMSNDEQIYQILEASAQGSFVVLIHAENDGLIGLLTSRLKHAMPGAIGVARSRPVEAEEEAVGRVLLLAHHARGRIHLVHLSCSGSVKRLKEARQRGVWSSGEVCPHHLLLSETRLQGKDGHLYSTCPPLRTSEEAAQLWKAVGNGDVQLVATDSCGFTPGDKETWDGDFTRLPMGLPGVETSLRLLYTNGVSGGFFSLERLVQLMSANPARLLGVYPRKGSLAVGSDADIVIFEPGTVQKLAAADLVSEVGWSPYEGFLLEKPPQKVYLRGRLIAKSGEFVGEIGAGRALLRGKPQLPV